MNPARVVGYFKVFARVYVRRRIGVFFSLVFPVILILLFGAIYSSSGSEKVSVYVQNLDHGSNASEAFVRALNSTGALSVTTVPASAGNLSAWLTAHGDTDGIVIPDGFEAALANRTPIAVTIYSDPADAGDSGVVEGAVTGVVNGFNLAEAGAGPVLSATEQNVGVATYSTIDYLVPGLISFSILTSPMFAITNVAAQMKKDHLFRQLSLTPLTRGEWLLASILWFLVMVAVSTFLMLGIGRAAFGADVSLTWLSLPFLLVGPVIFVSIGLISGIVSKGPESAAVVGNLITFPMMFLSGTFFPVDLFPTYLQEFAHLLPLYYVVEGLDNTMIFGNTSAALVDLAIVVGLAVVFFALAVALFRWREE